MKKIDNQYFAKILNCKNNRLIQKVTLDIINIVNITDGTLKNDSKIYLF